MNKKTNLYSHIGFIQVDMNVTTHIMSSHQWLLIKVQLFVIRVGNLCSCVYTEEYTR